MEHNGQPTSPEARVSPDNGHADDGALSSVSAETFVASRGTGPAPAVENAAARILGTGLTGGPSPLDPQLYTWDLEVAEELLDRLGSESQLDEHAPVTAVLQEALAEAPTPVILLAAELLYLQQLPLSTVTAGSKRHRIRSVLSLLDGAELPQHLDAALDAHGPITGGLGFSIQIREHLQWLASFITVWASLPGDQREAALINPWDFQTVAASVSSEWRSIRYAFEYLCWPGFFEPIIKEQHKTRIRDAFADRIGGASGSDELSVDRDLHDIRRVLSAETGEAVDWYRGAVSETWQRRRTDAFRRAWLVRAGARGQELIDNWVSQGRVSLPATHLTRLPASASQSEVTRAVERSYQHLDYHARLQTSTELYSFLSRMAPGDLVTYLSGGRLHVGLVTEDFGYVDDNGQQLERSVNWTRDSVETDQLDSLLSKLVEEPGTLVDLTGAIGELEGLFSHSRDIAGESPSTAAAPAGASTVPELPHVGSEVADTLFMDPEALDDIIDLLQQRQQVVLYGPPGTGKTFVAQELARALAGPDEPGRVQLVQFHPSYSYEDFFEGYRPTITESGHAGFELKAGPLRRLAMLAADPANASAPCFLIIDEMNRADLARVFGELYFLLEYRDRTVLPQYSPDNGFRMPRNLFIIGTMNTADRSIAMVDAAIRRRFAFVELHPSEEPVKDVLRRYLEVNELPTEAADLMTELNSRIEDADRDLQIGPSYFMRSDIAQPGVLEQIFRHDLLPLLEEHHVGRLSRSEVHDRFGLDVLRRALAQRAGTD